MGEFVPDPNQVSMERRVRDPLKHKGLRTRFRTWVRKQGFAGKFSTDLWRGNPPHIIVECKDADVEAMRKVVVGWTANMVTIYGGHA